MLRGRTKPPNGRPSLGRPRKRNKEVEIRSSRGLMSGSPMGCSTGCRPITTVDLTRAAPLGEDLGERQESPCSATPWTRSQRHTGRLSRSRESPAATDCSFAGHAQQAGCTHTQAPNEVLPPREAASLGVPGGATVTPPAGGGGSDSRRSSSVRLDRTTRTLATKPPLSARAVHARRQCTPYSGCATLPRPVHCSWLPGPTTTPPQHGAGHVAPTPSPRWWPLGQPQRCGRATAVSHRHRQGTWVHQLVAPPPAPPMVTTPRDQRPRSHSSSTMLAQLFLRRYNRHLNLPSRHPYRPYCPYHLYRLWFRSHHHSACCTWMA